MSRPKQTVLKALRQTLPAQSRLLLAVSGGSDSVAMLHGCYLLASRLRLEIEVAHLDHGLRAESKSDLQFVKRLATSFGLLFHCKTLKKPVQGVNIEEWGRQQRYLFFTRLLDIRDLDYVVTAHTADDLAETLLMRLVSNKELKSIEAISEQGRRLRPLLSVTKEEIYRHLTKYDLSFVQDQTNSDPQFLRNRVRHKLLPLLAREFDPRIVETLAERATSLAADINYLYALLNPALEIISKHGFGNRSWLRTTTLELAKLPSVLSWRLAELLFKPKLGFNLGRSHSEAIIKVLLGETVATQLPGGFRLQRKGGGIELLCLDKKPVYKGKGT